MSQKNNTIMAQKIAHEISCRGGRAYYVGGFVRDLIRGVESTDIDIEIHGLDSLAIKEVLNEFGECLEIGESFGIYTLKGYNIDIAMPREETLTGKGHRSFDVCVDPKLGTYKAASRRDFTVNALLMDVLTGEITDHFGGICDIENKLLRHVNDKKFSEDPLRVLRGAQFAARFDYNVCSHTIDLCREISLSDLSGERVNEEIKKALLFSRKPSVFFEVLRSMGQLVFWFPEVEKLIGVEQNPMFHPEGDVWNHTMLVIDNAVALRGYVKEPYFFMLSALCHDFGKACCTKNENGKITSYNHETEGLKAVGDFLKRFTSEKKLIKYVLNMTENHMKPYVLATNKSSVKATNKMFDLSIEPEDLIYLSLADNCTKKDDVLYGENKDFLIERLSVYREYMSRDYVSGKDLIDAGVKPSATFKDILAFAHKLRLSGIDKKQALKETISYSKKYDKNQ